MIPKHVVALTSGGLDSITAMYWLRHQGCNVHALSVDYKQAHAEQELACAKFHCDRLGILSTLIELPALGGLTDENWIVPNRNAILLSLAVNLAVRSNSEAVIIGCNADDEAAFPDCRFSFIQTFNAMLLTAKVPVEVCAPFLDWPKWKIGAMARELGVPTDKVYSCYRGGKEPCGNCPACEKLKLALATTLDHPDPYYGVGGIEKWKT